MKASLNNYFDRRHDPAIQAKKLAKRYKDLGFEVTMTKAVAEIQQRQGRL